MKAIESSCCFVKSHPPAWPSSCMAIFTPAHNGRELTVIPDKAI